MWDKTGLLISGLYLGEIPYKGIVESSRVKYGGAIQYKVRLLDMIEVFGEWRSTILVDSNDEHMMEE